MQTNTLWLTTMTYSTNYVWPSVNKAWRGGAHGVACRVRPDVLGGIRFPHTAQQGEVKAVGDAAGHGLVRSPSFVAIRLWVPWHSHLPCRGDRRGCLARSSCPAEH
jgi:hypothetical protein